MAIDATVGGASANSYLDVAAADALAADDLGPAAERWLAAATADKEKALKRATREIDGWIAERGSAPWSATQALLFPRVGDVDASDVPFIHRNVQQATYEQATYVLDNAAALDEAASRRAKGFFSYTNPDGTGGSLAANPDFGLLAPHVEHLMLEVFRRDVGVGSAPIRSATRAATVRTG